LQALLLELIKNNTTQELRPLLQNFSKEKIARVRSFHRSMWGYYQSTPLVELKELAAWLGVRNIFVKDESGRFGLKAFKGLGGPTRWLAASPESSARKLTKLTLII
jgi:diaminopropionate ammonia-lyase